MNGLTSIAYANELRVSNWFQGDISAQEIVTNILETLTGSIFAVAGAVFILGAFFLTLGFVKEEYRTQGKDMMITALIGMGVVILALIILNSVVYFVYGS